MEKFFESIKGALPYVGVSLASIIVTIVVMFLILGGSSKSSIGVEDLGIIGLTKVKPSSYVLKVNEYYLSTDEFNKQYKAIVETLAAGDKEKIGFYITNMESKKQFLENTLNELVIAVQAYNEGFLSSEKWISLSRLTLRKAIADGFLPEKIDLSSITVSDKEVEEVYQQQKAYFKEMNIPPDKAEEYIRAQLKSNKLNKKLSEYILKVRDRMAIDKLEENVR